MFWQESEHPLNPIVTWLFEQREERKTKITKTTRYRLLLHANAKRGGKNGNDMLCLLQMAIDGNVTLRIRIRDAGKGGTKAN